MTSIFSRPAWALLPLLCFSPVMLHAAPAPAPAPEVATTAAGVAPGTDVAQLAFDATPVEAGVTFARQGVSKIKTKIGSQETEAWAVRSGANPQQGWLRSWRLQVTDPRFLNGGRGVVDVEVTYFLGANSGVDVWARTARGFRRVAGGWGNTRNWRTLRFSLDDAAFGVADVPGGDGANTGMDLRIDGANADFLLKSVKIVGYNPRENVAWNRMLRITGVKTETPGGLLAFTRQGPTPIRMELRNLAQVARPLRYSFAIRDFSDQVRHRTEGEVSLAPGATQSLRLPFDPSKWPLGPYEATFSLYLNQGDKTPILGRELRLGIVSDATLPKARDGEFLYGLDAANTSIYPIYQDDAFALYRLMGVDILRHLLDKGQKETPEDVGRALQTLAAQNLQGGLMFGPPTDADAARRARELDKRTALLEELARRFGGRGVGKIHFWELGNEPDLTFFYPGPIPDYTRSFEAMSAAIKRGTAAAGGAPQDTLVMNGGLSFAGKEGDARSREFLRVVDGARLDAIAYHGHGAGIKAERSALERTRQAAKDGGKVGLPFVETESGYSGSGRAGMLEQARTVVEKMTYAQSQGLPTFYFFRLFMEGQGHEGGYGLTENRIEPRPSVLAYRNMVERLRHHKWVKNLDFENDAGRSGLNALVFAEQDANGVPTGRKTLVAWSEKPGSFDLSVRLDAAKKPVQNAQVFDLWGNASPANLIGSGTVSLPVGQDATFLSWRSSGAAEAVAMAPSQLQVEARESVPLGATTTLPVLVRNPGETPLKATVAVEASARVPLQANVSPAQTTVAPGGSASLQLSLAPATTDAPLALPTWWKVFLDVDPNQVAPTLAALGASGLPASVPGLKGAASGQFVSAPNNSLSFLTLAGGLSEKRPALATAILDAPRDLKLPVAASADWWMAWFVNGQKVFDTLETGNTGTLASQTFDLPLKRGRNVISALVLSGSQGWKLDFVGSKERTLAQTGLDPDRVALTLRAGDKILARQVVPLQLEAPVPALNGPVSDDLDAWMPLQPLAVLDERGVTNFFVKEPDQSRWYGGAKDSSGLAWLRDDGQNLHLFVAATDDRLVQASAPDQLAQNDSLQVRLTREDGSPLLDARAGLIGGQGVLVGAPQGVQSRLQRDEAGQRVLYHLTIPKTLVGVAPFRLALTLFDNDGDGLKQTLSWGAPSGTRLIAR